MLGEIEILRVRYSDIRIPSWQNQKFRGFFARNGETGSLLHNHGEDNKYLYRYPMVQYKVIDMHPVVVAVSRGIQEVYSLTIEHTELTIGGKMMPCKDIDLNWQKALVGDTDGICTYQFLTPWFALNQNNYNEYKRLNDLEKTEMLERILVGNLMSLSKGIGITVDREISASANLHEVAIPFKGETVLGFYGVFRTNYEIPSLLGIGKSVSRGFGTVAKL